MLSACACHERGEPTGPSDTVRMMAISSAPATARKHRLAAFVSAAMCGTEPEFTAITPAPKIPSPLSSQHVHHSAGSHAVSRRCSAGSPARQMSPMIWNGNQMLTMGTIQAPEGPATCAPLRVAVPFGVDPGPVEPHDEQDAQTEDRGVGRVVQLEVSKVVHASRAEQLDGQPGPDEGDNNGQQDREDVRQPS